MFHADYLFKSTPVVVTAATRQKKVKQKSIFIRFLNFFTCAGQKIPRENESVKDKGHRKMVTTNSNCFPSFRRTKNHNTVYFPKSMKNPEIISEPFIDDSRTSSFDK